MPPAVNPSHAEFFLRFSSFWARKDTLLCLYDRADYWVYVCKCISVYFNYVFTLLIVHVLLYALVCVRAISFLLGRYNTWRIAFVAQAVNDWALPRVFTRSFATAVYFSQVLQQPLAVRRQMSDELRA